MWGQKSTQLQAIRKKERTRDSDAYSERFLDQAYTLSDLGLLVIVEGDLVSDNLIVLKILHSGFAVIQIFSNNIRLVSRNKNFFEVFGRILIPVSAESAPFLSKGGSVDWISILLAAK